MQLLQGSFEAQDAIMLLKDLVQVKIKFHENKIANSNQIEDIKFREVKIKRLQSELQQVVDEIKSSNQKTIGLNGKITITEN